MIATLAVSLLALHTAGGTDAAPIPLNISDKAIAQAVREVIAESRAAPVSRRNEADTIRADKYQVFAAQFAQARVPDCLHPDALKRQPPVIGPFAFADLYAVPFVVLAKVRGKCN